MRRPRIVRLGIGLMLFALGMLWSIDTPSVLKHWPTSVLTGIGIALICEYVDGVLRWIESRDNADQMSGGE